MCIKFKHQEAEYLSWVQKHPSGFVINTHDRPATGYVVLHSSSCRSIKTYQKSHRPNAFTGNGYIKICAGNADELFRWAKEHRRNVAGPKICKICNRQPLAQVRQTSASNAANNHFVSTFKRTGAPDARGKFLSRVFGIFSEEIVRIWATDPRAPFEDIGRPTLRADGDDKGSTLDFTFRSRGTGLIYPAELKCEIEYQRYRYCVLTNIEQLKHHTKPAFDALLAAATKKPGIRTYVQQREVPIDGAILVWGAATQEGRLAAMRDKGFFDVLTIADMVADLQAWESEPYRAHILERRIWCEELFDGLKKPD